MPDVAHARQRVAGDQRKDDPPERRGRPHADRERGLDLAAVYGAPGARNTSACWAPKNDSDGHGAGGEARQVDETLMPGPTGDAGQEDAAAEGEEIDDEKIGDAAQDRRVGRRQAGEGAAACDPRPRRERAERPAYDEAGAGDRHCHRRALQERRTPAAGTEAHELEEAHLSMLCPPLACRAHSAATAGKSGITSSGIGLTKGRPARRASKSARAARTSDRSA